MEEAASAAASPIGSSALSTGGWSGIKKILHAVRVAFDDSLPTGRYPTCLLHLDIDPSISPIINVHPTKSEIRFRDNRGVHDFINMSFAGCAENRTFTGFERRRSHVRSRAARVSAAAGLQPQATGQPTGQGSRPVLPEPRFSRTAGMICSTRLQDSASPGWHCRLRLCWRSATRT